jgi:tetraacyldisaccharide 4'-kinase
LIPLSWIYGQAAIWQRERQSRRARALPVPVISVGNITCGGTGKTPAAEMIARDLLSLKRKPAFLSRGYARGRPAEAGNDEFQVLARNLPGVPHFQGADRYRAGLEAIAAGADVLVLDDGFQHARLHRDLDLVLIDALRPFGGGYTLPAGLLREPLAALLQADLIGITRSNQVEPRTLSTLSAYLRNRFPGIRQLFLETDAVSWVSRAGETAPPPALRGRSVLAFCGIGNPEGFRRQLLSLGVEPAHLLCFPDHRRYTDADLQRISKRAKELHVDEVVMTQKDAVKVFARESCRTESGGGWWYLRVEQRVARGAEEYGRALRRALRLE